MPVITCIEDLRELHKKNAPKAFYDYVDAGSYTESTYRANSADLAALKLRQRVGVNMENRSTESVMIEHQVKMPVALAPVGLTGMHLLDRGRGRSDHPALLVPALCDARPRLCQTPDRTRKGRQMLGADADA